MSCEGLIKRLGFECRMVSQTVIAVDTPFAFADGDPIGFYLEEQNDSLLLSDNSDTLSHFGEIGWDITDRRNWKAVKQIVSGFGFELTDFGEIVAHGIKSQGQSLFSGYVSAMLAVADLEREYLGVSDEVDKFVQEVEFYLMAWKPNVELSHLPIIRGHSGRTHTFHFDFDGKLIDAARPHSGRTGSILRKAADVINSGTAKPIMIVMDDREDPERAAIETDIISTMVSVLPFTRLAENGSNNQLQ